MANAITPSWQCGLLSMLREGTTPYCGLRKKIVRAIFAVAHGMLRPSELLELKTMAGVAF